MFVFLSKFLPPFAYPLGFAIILLVLALVLHHYRRLERAGIIAAVLILLIASNQWVAFSLARSLEWQYLPTGEIPQADAIVLLGGGTDSAEPPRPLCALKASLASACFPEGI